MRQSRKEANLQWMMREGLMPERREAMAYSAQAREEFGGDLGSGGTPSGGAHGRKHPPGGRG
ncbi:hypothetical protein ACFPPD_12170 [Cohnella suwonensis]|uniref:Uncharacterized protein n=1 Tax=Cohnella suwonensis TaxID=696072 RepID=A0ABW0LUF1_9BACL